MRGLLGADRLIACGPDKLHLKFGNVLRAFRPVGVCRRRQGKERRIDPALFLGTQIRLLSIWEGGCISVTGTRRLPYLASGPNWPDGFHSIASHNYHFIEQIGNCAAATRYDLHQIANSDRIMRFCEA
jgi:hypothetical protein